MITLTSGTRDLVRAILAYECAEGLADRDAIAAIRDGDIEYWIDAIEASGMFAPGELRRIRVAFETDPEELISVMLEGADELRGRRLAEYGPVGDWSTRELTQATG